MANFHTQKENTNESILPINNDQTVGKHGFTFNSFDFKEKSEMSRVNESLVDVRQDYTVTSNTNRKET